MPGSRLDFDLFGSRSIIERQLVATSGFDLADIVLAIVIRLRWRILPVPQSPHDIRVPHIVLVEGDQHLVIDFGQEVGAAAGARHWDRDASPETLLIFPRRVPDFDSPESFRVAIVRHDSDRDAFYLATLFVRIAFQKPANRHLACPFALTVVSRTLNVVL
jgi:hypothetical protein